MEDGEGWAVSLQQCHPNSVGSLVIARRTEWNIVLLFSLCCRLPPKLGETAKVYRIGKDEGQWMSYHRLLLELVISA